MNECVIHAHNINPILLLVIGLLLGIVVGLLIAAGILIGKMYLEALQEGRAEQQRRWEQQRREDEALALTQNEEEINSAQDAAITCSLCWEARHPGLDWPKAWGTRTDVCGSHYNRHLLTKMMLTDHNIILYRNDENSHRDYALAG